ncbi:MAG: hypothetical protein PUA69_06975 [Erysipelotrichaceae bacterium]|nr:hypothetical protein [Erysipelotrichaceae bacterium]
MNCLYRHTYLKGKPYRRRKVSDPETYLSIAIRAMRMLEYSEKHTDTGLYWDTEPGTSLLEKRSDQSDLTLYSGTTGVIYSHLLFYDVTKDSLWKEKAEAGLNWLAANWKENIHENKPEDYGYYMGVSGIGSVFLTAGDILNENRWYSEALHIMGWLKEKAINTKHGVIWKGRTGLNFDAGSILFLCACYKHHMDTEKIIRSAGDAYLDYRDGTNGDIYDNNDHAMPNFFYGTAGSAYMMAELYQCTKDEKYLNASEEMADWLMRIAVKQKTGVLIPYIHEDNPIFYVNLCHGPAGTSKAFDLLYDITGKQMYQGFMHELYLGTKDKGVPYVQSDTLWNNVSYCCGTAGLLNWYTGMYLKDYDEEYKRLAMDCGEILVGEAEYDHDLPYWPIAFSRHHNDRIDVRTGFFSGNAGIAVQLLQLYCLLTGRYQWYSMPDDPFSDRFRKREIIYEV